MCTLMEHLHKFCLSNILLMYVCYIKLIRLLIGYFGKVRGWTRKGPHANTGSINQSLKHEFNVGNGLTELRIERKAFRSTFTECNSLAVWPDWVIYRTLGNFLKPLATINLPKSTTFLINFCKGVKIYHFRTTLIDIWRFFSGHTDLRSSTFFP